jgi:hypothetical protein
VKCRLNRKSLIEYPPDKKIIHAGRQLTAPCLSLVWLSKEPVLSSTSLQTARLLSFGAVIFEYFLDRPFAIKTRYFLT